MKDKPGDEQRLLHILTAISEIEAYITNISFEEFANNSMMRYASIKQLEIIGEAAYALSKEVKTRFTG